MRMIGSSKNPPRRPTGRYGALDTVVKGRANACSGFRLSERPPGAGLPEHAAKNFLSISRRTRRDGDRNQSRRSIYGGLYGREP